MKTKTSLLICMLFISILLFSQAINIYTPNGTKVMIETHSEMSQPEILIWNDKTANEFTNSFFLDNASYLYNCHSYAWNMKKEGGPKCWIQHPDPYMSDGSYERTFNEAEAEIVFYRTLDPYKIHSAIKSSIVPGMYESKWGKGSLVRHDLNDVPSELINAPIEFYKKAAITGTLNVLCPTNTYKFNHGQATSWEVSAGFTITASNGTSATVQVNNGANGQSGTLTAKKNGVSAGQRNIQACNVTLTGPNNMCINQSQTFSVSNAPTGFTWDKSANLSLSGSDSSVFVMGTAVSSNNWVSVKYGNIEMKKIQGITVNSTPAARYINGASWTFPNTWESFNLTPLNGGGAISWSLSPSDGGAFLSPPNSSTDYVSFYAFNPNTVYTITATITLNGCIIAPSARIFVNASSPAPPPAIVYPNPAVDILHIEIDPIAFNKSSGLEGAEERAVMQQPDYDIRLYDSQGNLVRQASSQSSKLSFNVSNLPNGIYFLTVSVGINDKPSIQRVIINH